MMQVGWMKWMSKQSNKQKQARATKGFYIQEKYAMAFDRLVFNQKQAKGKKAPELAEEAIKILLKKYGEDVKSL